MDLARVTVFADDEPRTLPWTAFRSAPGDRTLPGASMADDPGPVGKRRLAYRIEFMPDTNRHLNSLTARDRSTVLDAIERKLQNEPSVATRNRKRMRPGWN